MAESLLKIFWLLLAVTLPVLPGWLLLRCLYRHSLHRYVTIALSFIIGKSVLTLLLFLAMTAGLQLTHLMVLAVWGALTGGMGGLHILCRKKGWGKPTGKLDQVVDQSQPRSKVLYAASVLLHTGIVTLLAGYFLISLRRPVESIPEVTIWAFKAKVLALTGAISREMLALPDFSYMQPGYPLGYPLFLSWCYLWMGEVDDYLIKLIPPMLGALACLLLYGLLRMQGLSRLWCALLVLLFASGQQFLACSIQLYAEVPLLLCIVPGIWFLARAIEEEMNWSDLVLAGILLGSAAWIKNEGALFLLAGCAMAVMTASDTGRKRHVRFRPLAALLPAVAFVLPWRLWTSHLTSQASDFSFTWPVLQKGIGNAGAIGWDFLNAYILIPSTISGLGILGLVVTVIFWKRVWRTPGTRLLLAVILLMIAGYAGMFFFSTREIQWHLYAAYRIALPVSGLLLTYIVRLNFAGWHFPEQGRENARKDFLTRWAG